MVTPYPVFPVFAFLSFILVLIPLPWHLHAWNSGTCLFMIWTAIACLIQFINSIIWHGNIVDWAPIWCDISTRLSVGITVAIPAASLCINRRLHQIATCPSATITRSQKLRAVFIDLSIGIGIPALQMPLQFIVQGHRYDIWEDVGCLPTTVNTPPAYPLTYLWPNVISLISAVYGVLTVRAFLRRRAQFSQLASSNPSLSMNRYFRLMCLATIDIFFTIPISTFGLYLNAVSQSIYPWISWSDIHYDWYTVDAVPASIWRSIPQMAATIELDRWVSIICALVFFAFFGFAEESRKNYRAACFAVARRLGVSRHFPRFNIEQKETKVFLPLYTPKKPTSFPMNRDSFQSASSISGQTVSETLVISSGATDAKESILKFPSSLNSSRSSRYTI